MMNRRDFLKGASVATAAGLAGCIGEFGEQPYVDGTVKMLMSPTEPQEQMRAQYDPVGERIGSHVEADVDVEMQYAANYAATLEAMNSGTGDIAETGPFAAALAVDTEKAEVLLQRKGYGSWTYHSVIVTREDSDVESLEDLQGEKIAFADPLSASGSLFPLFMLKKAGLSIPDQPGSPEGADFEPTWSGHATALESLQNEQAVAAGVGRFIAWDYETSDYVEGVRELGHEDGLPRAPIVVSPELDDSEKETLKTAFTEADDGIYYGADGEEGTEDDLWFDGVRESDASTYDYVVEVANELGYGEEIFENQ
jgi:phosphonate transport system substrate-binding protein